MTNSMISSPSDQDGLPPISSSSVMALAPSYPTLYKTEICNNFSAIGNCSYGDNCQFAHGIDELRVPIRHHRWRTEACRTWNSSGTCRYGDKCCFIHATPAAVHKVTLQTAVTPQTHVATAVNNKGVLEFPLHEPDTEKGPNQDYQQPLWSPLGVSRFETVFTELYPGYLAWTLPDNDGA